VYYFSEGTVSEVAIGSFGKLLKVIIKNLTTALLKHKSLLL